MRVIRAWRHRRRQECSQRTLDSLFSSLFPGFISRRGLPLSLETTRKEGVAGVCLISLSPTTTSTEVISHVVSTRDYLQQITSP